MANPLFDEIYAVGQPVRQRRDFSSESGAHSPQSLASTRRVTAHPGQPPYAERFSNGPVLPEITADLLGATFFNFRSAAPRAWHARRSPDAAGSCDSRPGASDIARCRPMRGTIEAVLNQNINLPSQVAQPRRSDLGTSPSADSRW